MSVIGYNTFVGKQRSQKSNCYYLQATTSCDLAVALPVPFTYGLHDEAGVQPVASATSRRQLSQKARFAAFCVLFSA